MTKAVIDLLGDHVLMYQSDYPHPETIFPDHADTVLAWRQVLGEQATRKLMWENASRFFRLTSTRGASARPKPLQRRQRLRYVSRLIRKGGCAALCPRSGRRRATMPVSDTKQDHIGIVTLSRPEARNAWGLDFTDGIARYFAEMEDDDDVRCAVLTGDDRVEPSRPAPT